MSGLARLAHAKVRLALHQLAGGDGLPLLLLHGLGGRSPAAVPDDCAAWPGPVHALDFTGHGASTVPAGGGYTAEILMGDADAALAEVGPATVLGRGLGAYVALLIAGARPDLVRGAVLCDGPGLAGGGPRPSSPTIISVPDRPASAPDPFALIELATDMRPGAYATGFARQANQRSDLTYPLSVCAMGRPDWLAALVDEPGVQVCTAAEALAGYAVDASF